MGQDELISAQFSTLAISLTEFYAVLGETHSLKMKIKTQAFLKGEHGPDRNATGPAVFEIKKPKHDQILSFLARFPNFHVTKITTPVLAD